MKTTNYENSKKLKEIGFKADTNFYWYCYDKGEECRHISEADGRGDIKSFDLETILEALPKKIKPNGVTCRFEMFSFRDDSENELFSVGYMITRNFSVSSTKDESLADTAARLLILLIEKRVVKL